MFLSILFRNRVLVTLLGLLGKESSTHLHPETVGSRYLVVFVLNRLSNYLRFGGVGGGRECWIGYAPLCVYEGDGVSVVYLEIGRLLFVVGRTVGDYLGRGVR